MIAAGSSFQKMIALLISFINGSGSPSFSSRPGCRSLFARINIVQSLLARLGIESKARNAGTALRLMRSRTRCVTHSDRKG
jgi:hypothetical protein